MSDRYRLEIPTRWMDTDAYGHVNNVEYYSFFDTALTTWLVREGGFRPLEDPSIGLCVESKCSFRAPIDFPAVVEATVAIGELGRSSVRYEIALAVDGETVGEGYFVHVYVDRETRRSAPIPAALRERMTALEIAPACEGAPASERTASSEAAR
jgi:acyl-CoA thioester hydrolase